VYKNFIKLKKTISVTKLFVNNMASLDIKLKKVNKIYHEDEKIVGTIAVIGKGEVVHNGIMLTVEGNVNMQLSSKSVGLFEAFYNSVKPISLINTSMEIAKPGKLPSGKTEIPFEVNLKSLKHKELFETYHGVFINVQYSMKCDMKRPILNKDLQKTCEFIIEYKQQKPEENKKIQFKIATDTIKSKKSMPKFLINGYLDSGLCRIDSPFTGELKVESSEIPIKSMELQLVRVETCGCAEGFAKDATEIQNLQIAEGDVCRDMYIPIYMIFPRLFTCPTTETPNFKIEFEINIVIVFKDEHLVTENFPIRTYR